MSTLNVNNINEVGGVNPVITAGDIEADAITAINASALPAGSIVDVQSVIKTDTFTGSVASAGNLSVTGLSISHTMQSASNKLILIAFFGSAGIDSEQRGNVGIAVADDGTLVNVGAAAGSRALATAGGRTADASPNSVAMPHITTLYEPGDTVSHTYTVRAVNLTNTTRTIYINRIEGDSDVAEDARTASALTIMEVAG